MLGKRRGGIVAGGTKMGPPAKKYESEAAREKAEAAEQEAAEKKRLVLL